MGNGRSVFDREAAEYRTLCASLGELHKMFLKRKEEVRSLLEETAVRKREAFIVIAKANGLTRYLSGHQRKITNLAYRLPELKARIHKADTLVFPNGAVDGKNETLPEARGESLPDRKNRRELKERGLLLISLIDGIKKKLLQLDLLELRCRELILSVNKALEVFRFEFTCIRRRLYPFGVFSLFRRSLRRFFGSGYFTAGDLDEVAALGRITGLVLKIADALVM